MRYSNLNTHHSEKLSSFISVIKDNFHSKHTGTMKRFIYFITVYFLSVGLVIGQEFPKTYTNTPCINCAPPGYSVVSGGPVALSNMTGLGGSPLKPWSFGFAAPPSSQAGQQINQNNVFLTLKYTSSQKDKVKAIVGGFEPGFKYTMSYYVLASKISGSDYAKSALVQVETTGGTPYNVASNLTYFYEATNVNQWVKQSFTFTSPAAELAFYLSGVGDPQKVSYVSFDIHPITSFECIVPGGPVELYRTSVETIFPCAPTNLYSLVKSQPPVGTVPVWGVNSASSYPQLTELEAKAIMPKSTFQYYYAFFKSPGGCYNTDISTVKVGVRYVETQVSLKGHSASVDCIKKSTVDLTAQVNDSPYKVRWFDNDKHQGLPIDNPNVAPVGDYFAFYYDPINQCYSTDKATVDAVFSVVGSTMRCNDPNDPSNQIILKFKTATINPPAQTFNLTTAIPSEYVPGPGEVFEWFTNAGHVGTPIADPTQVGAGTYYVFLHDTVNGCYNTNASTSSVTVSKVCNAGAAAVPLIDNSNQFYCQGEQINLNDYVIGAPPAGSSVVWFTNNTHSGSPVTVGSTEGGNYYAYYYDAVNDCYNQDQGITSALHFTSAQVPINCSENGCLLSTGCPPTSVNLNSLHIGPVPAGLELRWFNNTTHSGEKVTDPDNVTAAGDYYAFYYHTTKQCYNKTGLQNGGNDQANKKVTITNENCNLVTANIKVALQGAREQIDNELIMRDDLRVAGLLPTVDPYGGGATFPQINSNFESDLKVVDWIKLEVRSAANPATVLQSKSLLLLADGRVRDVNGLPVFDPQSEPVRIVVKHRNHISVISKIVQAFIAGSTIEYDFTTSLTQAFNEFGDPAQMVQKDGIWCLLSGDINAIQDYVIDGTDGTFFNTQFRADTFDTYDRADLNMDGVVDGVDGTLFNNNFYAGFFSTIINY